MGEIALLTVAARHGILPVDAHPGLVTAALRLKLVIAPPAVRLQLMVPVSKVAFVSVRARSHLLELHAEPCFAIRKRPISPAGAHTALRTSSGLSTKIVPGVPSLYPGKSSAGTTQLSVAQ